MIGGNTCSPIAGVKHTLFDRAIDTGDLIGIIAGSTVVLGLVGITIWILKKDTRVLRYVRPSQDDELPVEESQGPQVLRHDEAPQGENAPRDNHEIEVRDVDPQDNVALENDQTKAGINEENNNNPAPEIESNRVSLTQIRIKRSREFPRLKRDL